MRISYLLAVACIMLTSLTLNADQLKPNIVVIVIDDLGYMDIQPNNPQSFYETPNLNKLAETGMRFTQGYAACPVCSPTRYSLMTGRYPVRAAATNYFGGMRVERFQPADFNNVMPLTEVTLAEALQENGYQTCFIGKWHLGPDEAYYPEKQGFDLNIGGFRAGAPKSYFSPYNNPKLTNGPKGEYLSARLASEASKFIASPHDKPFLLYYCMYDVHVPLQAPQELISKYQEKAERLGIANKQLTDDQLFGPESQYFVTTENPRTVRLVQQHATYAAMVEAMDTAVGTVMKSLDDAGLADNTLIVFTSDNGGLSTAEGQPTSNLPLRGGKGWGYEGGIRVPWIVRWPGKTKPGSTSETPIVSTDLYPTVLEVIGAEPKPEQHIDGVSFVPSLTQSPAAKERSLFWHYPHYANQGGFPCSVIRKGNWKLLVNLENGNRELYDLNKDLSEQNNLASENTGVSNILYKELVDWLADSDARLLKQKEGQTENPWNP